MSEHLVPEGLSLMELAAVNWVLAAVKTKIRRDNRQDKSLTKHLKSV